MLRVPSPPAATSKRSECDADNAARTSGGDRTSTMDTVLLDIAESLITRSRRRRARPRPAAGLSNRSKGGSIKCTEAVEFSPDEKAVSSF